MTSSAVHESEHFRGVARMWLATPIARFMAVGVASTLAYALLFLALSGPLGSTAANLLALAITAVGNTAVNRRVTFDVRGREGLLGQHAAGLLVFGVAVCLTNAALAVMHGLDARASQLVEVTVLIAANLAATVMRYLALRSWVFRPAGRIGGSRLGRAALRAPTH